MASSQSSRTAPGYPDRFAAAKAQGKLLPGQHTSKFEPDPEPTLATGVKAMAAVATALLQ